MDVSPNITRTLKVAGMICLPVCGVLVGIAGVFFWLSATTAPPPVEKVPESTTWEAPSPLNIIRTGSLYLDSFKSASLYQTYEEAQGLVYAKVHNPGAASADAARSLPKKALLAQIADSMAIVPEARAGTPAEGTVQGKNGSIGAPKPPVNAPQSRNARPTLAQNAPKASATVIPANAAVPVNPVPGQKQRQNSASAQQEGQDSAQNSAQSKGEAFPETFKAGSLGQLTQLRAELEQLKMQVTIEETRSKLNQLRGGSKPGLSMPSLDFPPIGMPSGVATSNALRILSIQSVNGKYSATVGTAQGPKIVHINDSINGSRVVSISRNSVVISRGQGSETLTIQE